MLVELLSLPTSPLNERYVIEYIRRWAAERPAIQARPDDHGNLHLRLRRGRTRASRPLVLLAHMDHPGFEARRMARKNRLIASWRGGVAPEYFRNARARFYDGERWIRGRVTSVETHVERGRRRVRSAKIEVNREVPAGSIGMWDLGDPVIRASRIHARGCDDVAGVAAVLAALDELHRMRKQVDVHAILTRAEEIGFAGTIAVCRTGLVPRKARVVCIECSSAIPGVVMGGGPILRVGDGSTVFSPDLTAFCREVARTLARRHRGFGYQRKLMDAGSCESTVFREFGHDATGLCLALGNYHNMDQQRKRIAAEYIDLNDFDKLVTWLVALARARPGNDTGDPQARKWIHDLERKWLGALKRKRQH